MQFPHGRLDLCRQLRLGLAAGILLAEQAVALAQQLRRLAALGDLGRLGDLLAGGALASGGLRHFSPHDLREGAQDFLRRGDVTGGGTFSMGSFAQINAYPLPGCSFLGWYSMDISGNETLYSAENTITYTVPEILEPINIYAKYEVTEYFEVNCWEAYSDMDMKINYNGIEVDKLNGAILEKGTVITLTVTSLLDRTAFLGWKDGTWKKS